MPQQQMFAQGEGWAVGRDGAGEEAGRAGIGDYPLPGLLPSRELPRHLRRHRDRAVEHPRSSRLPHPGHHGRGDGQADPRAGGLEALSAELGALQDVVAGALEELVEPGGRELAPLEPSEGARQEAVDPLRLTDRGTRLGAGAAQSESWMDLVHGERLRCWWERSQWIVGGPEDRAIAGSAPASFLRAAIPEGGEQVRSVRGALRAEPADVLAGDTATSAPARLGEGPGGGGRGAGRGDEQRFLLSIPVTPLVRCAGSLSLVFRRPQCLECAFESTGWNVASEGMWITPCGALTCGNANVEGGRHRPERRRRRPSAEDRRRRVTVRGRC